MKTFSFIQHQFHSALEMANRILPTMQHASVFYYNENERKVLKINWSPEGHLHEEVATPVKVAIQKIRKDKTATGWTNVDDLVFESSKRKKKQYDLTDEMDNTVLVLKFISPYDGNYDLLYLYLDSSLSQFKMTSKSELLSTANKDILAKTLHNSIGFLLAQEWGNQAILKNIVDTKGQEREERKRLMQDLETIKKNYAKSILNYSLHHLDLISKEYNIKFKLAEDASQKLMTYVGDFEGLEDILKNAASAAYNLSYNNRTQIIIDAGHLILYDYKPKEKEHTKQRLESKYAKTVLYLDRYEEASQRLLLQDKAINGKNVANYCEPSISAAAITINIRAHKENMITLLERHPERWIVLKEHFRPIQNILKDQHLVKIA